MRRISLSLILENLLLQHALIQFMQSDSAHRLTNIFEFAVVHGLNDLDTGSLPRAIELRGFGHNVVEISGQECII